MREGGFSLPLLGKFSEKELGKEWARVDSGELCSQIVAIEGYDHAGILQPEPNTSLFFPRTSLPYLQKRATNRNASPDLFGRWCDKGGIKMIKIELKIKTIRLLLAESITRSQKRHSWRRETR